MARTRCGSYLLCLFLIVLFILMGSFLIKISTVELILRKTGTANVEKSTECPRFTEEEQEKLENGWENQEDVRLLELIRCKWINPPSKGPLNLEGVRKPGFGQSGIVDKILRKRTGGFFVECGALDGQLMSNTLFFEQERGWTGLLIEANPLEFSKLQNKGRNAYSLNACLNAENKTGKFLFDPVPISGGLVKEMSVEHKKSLKVHLPKINVQCFRFNSVMKALRRTHIDLFSLDVEGAEVPILNNIPFSDFTIDVILVEYYVMGSPSKRKMRYKEINELLNQTNMFDFVGTIHSFDMVFIRKGILHEDKLKEWRNELSGQI